MYRVNVKFYSFHSLSHLSYGMWTIAARDCCMTAWWSGRNGEFCDRGAAVASLGEADRPGWHPPGGLQRAKTKLFLWENLQRIVNKRGRTGEKGAGWHSPGGWHPSEINKRLKNTSKTMKPTKSYLPCIWKRHTSRIIVSK